MLAKETINEFRQILSEDYGENIDAKEATEMAESFVNYFDTLLNIHQKTKCKIYDDRKILTQKQN